MSYVNFKLTRIYDWQENTIKMGSKIKFSSQNKELGKGIEIHFE
jgi:hypothetical protein